MPSRDRPGALEIVPLTPDRWDDVAALFGAGGDPKTCWCMYWRVRSKDWSFANTRKLRDGFQRLVEEGRDPAPGLLAYRDGEASPVGWVSVAPREDYERLAYSTVLAPVDDRPVWSIVCFVVGRRERRQGVAIAMLDAAIDHARAGGAKTLEAYPADTGGERIASANAYVGTLSMFKRAGFKVVAVRQANASTAPRPIVRLEL